MVLYPCENNTLAYDWEIESDNVNKQGNNYQSYFHILYQDYQNPCHLPHYYSYS